jgi:hypothetical protein
MSKGMVADNVASLGDLADNFRTLTRMAPDDKECRVYSMLFQDFQQAQRVRIIRSIVVSEGQLPVPPRTAGR